MLQRRLMPVLLPPNRITTPPSRHRKARSGGGASCPPDPVATTSPPVDPITRRPKASASTGGSSAALMAAVSPWRRAPRGNPTLFFFLLSLSLIRIHSWWGSCTTPFTAAPSLPMCCCNGIEAYSNRAMVKFGPYEVDPATCRS
uniref:Uncharacterized protein n=1 Tax=Oryza punctata TaxID=4537 RepID=A0A0E0JJ33_ORYPU